MTLKQCERCREVYEDKGNPEGRMLIELMASMFPKLHEAVVGARNFCPACYRASVNPVAEGVYEEMKNHDR